MSTHQNNNEEEVDLGSLFTIIGKGFSKVFNFFGNIFKGIFHGIIISLIFLRQHFIKIGIAAIIGASLGAFLEFNKKDLYTSDLLVAPNFESTRQLYDNINYYNELVKQKDTLTLSKTFKIDKKSAGSLRKFSIETIKNEKDIINGYNDFILEVDTTTVKSYAYDEYKASFSDYDYRVHKINVISGKNDVFRALGEVIISSIVKNNYFSRYKEIANDNLNKTDAVLRQNLIQLDSLSNVYKNVLIQEAKKQTTGTNIDLGGRGNRIKELELFSTKAGILEDLEVITGKKIEKYEVINIISNFQSVGYKVKGLTKNYISLLGIFFVGIVIIFLLLLKLNDYLGSYKEK